WTERQSIRYLKELRESKSACREDLLPCVLAFRDFLATRNIKLRILLRPGKDDLLGEDGRLRTTPTESALALTAAEQTLKKAGIRAVNLLPDMYAEAALHPERPVTQPDGSHLSTEMVSVMGQTLCRSLEERQKQQAGRHMLLVGDCYALLTANQLKQGTILPGVRSQWKNSSDSQMAYEISRIPPEFFPAVREIYWFLSSPVLVRGSGHPLPLPSPPDAAAPEEEKIRAVLVRITRISKIPGGLGASSPYPNALALHECATDAGEKFLAIVPVMHDRVPLPARSWVADLQLILTMQPWDAATRATPNLGREQIFDDIQDFATARYHVSGWSFPP
ncbi:MAG TPA: hypothetical protein VLE43_17610, partial [Candidatus Saccharimonadia bacterium]|nr:hypothetical protein [Candidatus Saccharimonadia bacterium]